MKVSIPKDLSAITLEQYQKYEAIANGENDEDFLIFKTIEIFCDIDIQVVSKFPMKDAKEIYELIQDVLKQQTEFKPFFELNGVKYGFIPSLEDLTLGEYIDLEAGLKDTKDLHKAAAVMFRPVTNHIGDLYDIEPYKQGTKAWDIMKEAPIEAISGAVVFLQFRERIVLGFPSLFEQEHEGEERVDYSAEGQFSAKWGWFNSIFALSSGDLTKFNEVTKQSVFTALMYLEFMKEKNELEARQARRKYN